MIKRWILISLFTSLMAINACSPKSSQPDLSKIDGVRAVTQAQAEWITGLPGKVISNTSTIKIIFAKAIVGKEQVGQEETRQLLEFTPDLPGKAVWTSPSILEYMPSQHMPSFKVYDGLLLLPKLTELASTEPIKFTFETIGNELLDFDGNFKLIKEEKRLQYQLKGMVAFSREVKKKDLSKALRLTQKGWDLPLTLSGGEKGLSFEFTSQPLNKAKFDKVYTLTIKSKSLDLSSEIKRDFVLAKRQTFKVKQVEQLKDLERPGFVIKFTDSINKEQNPDGFVQLEPNLDMKLKVIDQKLFVYANFDFATDYQLTIKAGLKNYWGEVSKKEYKTILSFNDIKPAMKFTSKGVFLPTANQHSVTFQTINVKRIKLKIFKVFANNLGQFIQSENLHQANQSTRYGWSYNLERVGVEIKEQELKIGDKKNKWLVHKLDLKKIIGQEEKGLFLISLNFGKKDVLYENMEAKENLANQYYYGEDYYTNPYKDGYYEQQGNHLLPIIVSDIGLTVKKGENQVQAFATHLETTAPMSGVKIKLMTYQNQLIDEQSTDGQGKAAFDNVKQQLYYVEASKGNQRSIVKLSEMAWNLSGYNIGGIDQLPDGIRAFIYTDRGVYRPGEKIYVSLIARNKQHTFPKDHPIEIKFYSPKNQLMSEKNYKKSHDGFYCFDLKTAPNDMTGEWRLEVKAGASTFNHVIKIETVVPNRLKVLIEPDLELLATDNKQIKFELKSTYLFGAPASRLKAEVKGALEHREVSFEQFPGYSFIHEGVSYKSYRENILSTTLSQDGVVTGNWKLPDLSVAPSGLRAVLRAKVFEKGGRFTAQNHSIDINPHRYYVGIEKMSLEYGYLKIPATYTSRVVLVDQKGKVEPGRTINYRLYRNEHWWWWEVRSTDNRPLKFKNSSATELVDSGSLITRKKALELALKLEESGEYLLEVQEGNRGHTSGYFFHASKWWGSQGKKDAGNVILKSDKDKYQPGEKAQVRFPAPAGSMVLVSLEHGGDILSTSWEKIGLDSNECILTIPITKKMLPTVYVSVSILQKHSQTKNDMPIRLYGVLPLNVEDNKTRRSLAINMVDHLEPDAKFDVELKSEDGKPFQASISIVDVGLLDLTNYQTPDPWKFFFQKLRLGVSSYDLFAQVIGANKDDIYKLFSIGGGRLLRERKAKTSPIKAKRFKPVALFKGPLQSDKKGKIKTNFKMPNYIGAVKVMAVAANNQTYGHQDKVVPVKKDLMIQPTLPRVIGPDERFDLPINVITLKDGLAPITITIETTGPLDVDGQAKQVLKMKKATDKMIRFKIKSQSAVGEAMVKIKAQSGSLQASSETQIAVRPSSPEQARSEEKTIKKGETKAMLVPNDGLSGTNRASITIQRLPKLKLKHRVRWLIQYPYGCVEQITSSVFPQLFLKSFIKSKMQTEEKIDKNINAGIAKLQKYIANSGGFSYWPGSRANNPWANNYAGHFLVEAKKLGYHVPEHMYKNWLKYQHEQALKTSDDVRTRVYRTYSLALAGEPNLGAMNLLKENELKNMSNVEKWMLAATYQLAGEQTTARIIAEQAKLEVPVYHELGGSFGSQLRDQAIILEALILFDRMEEARQLFEIISAALSEQDWYGTQTVAYALLALGKYLQKIDANYNDKKPRMVGQLEMPDGQLVKFDTTDIAYTHQITKGFGQEVKVTLHPKTNISQVYSVMNWTGTPLKSELKDYEKNLSLILNWYNDEGVIVDPNTVKQGQSLWGHIRVRQTSTNRKKLSNLALVQILPSGWEIENLRMTGEPYPAWTNRFRVTGYDYLDIRDDRLMWFFNLNYYGDGEFLFKVNAITAGTFHLPPTQVEAMYDHNYQATKGGNTVTVLPAVIK